MQSTHAISPGQAFETDIPEHISLRTLFESPHVHKVVFDVRDISHFLYTECGISSTGVKDLQLMELAVRDSVEDKLGV
ncbi:putative 3 -5 exonuclease protein [Botrytis fragariae]|uniref:Putative 3 -5 exonuclease protein n=1 Tax=Botrytis fragariae TaxID=1964551 RepID=A0A8H6ALH7_9HELO|nr:putative 3 -5 exonuclease protein [Botrytis fragariae]KAF5869918.1 putative 3 -5 exonuclease protein [Botrytis fragariae]